MKTREEGKMTEARPEAIMRIRTMTFYELKNKIETAGGEKYFFSHDTLKFFGEALSRMRLLKNKASITDYRGDKHNCYVISATRTKNAFGSCRPYTYYHYFDDETYQRIIPD